MESSKQKHSSQEGHSPPPALSEAERHSAYDEENMISVTSYNILADLYTDPMQFPYCPMNFLNFQHRKNKIIDQIREMNSDIMCMQEVDHFDDFYQKNLEELGYVTVYLEKLIRKEGIITIFKKSKFKLIGEPERLNFDSMTPDKKLNQKHYARNNSALIIRLLYTPSASADPVELVIVNTHLYWNPRTEEIKLLQISHVLKRMTEIDEGDTIKADESSSEESAETAATAATIDNEKKKKQKNIILCGDLNSMPTSNVLKFILERKEPHPSRIELPFQKLVRMGDQKIIYQDFQPLIKIELESAFSNYQDTNDYPEFTNYTQKFKGNLDYIFYSKRMTELRLSHVSEIPIDKVKKEVGLPCKNYPSDHLPITAYF